MTQQDIIERERQFHNLRFSQNTDPRQHLDKWYHSIRHGAARQESAIRRLSQDADVLEYGCAGGELSLGILGLPAVCRTLQGIDISDVAVGLATRRASESGYINTEFVTMDAEAMSFDDNRFDVIYGRGIIHHLNLERSYAEIARVLKPGGVAQFYEPMGHNPLLNAYRGQTPELRTVDEHPLLVRDFDLARTWFGAVRVEYFGLMSVGSALAPAPAREAAFIVGRAIDSIVLKVPYLRRFAWYALITLTKAAAPPAHHSKH